VYGGFKIKKITTNIVVLKSISIPRQEYNRIIKKYPKCRVEEKKDIESGYIVEWIDGDSYPYRLIKMK
jgi:hypothetical protein